MCRIATRAEVNFPDEMNIHDDEIELQKMPQL